MQFKDHFSGHAGDYSKHRPSYPEALYDAVYAHVTSFDTAWDCGTGNGQVAVHLAERFDQVLATDASASQISHAMEHPKVSYSVCRAEHTPFSNNSFDLITVGQAIHWFDFEPFFEEVRRVAKKNSIFACWTYRFLTIDTETNAVLRRFFDLIEEYWPPERDHVEALYRTIPFPDDFEEQPMEDIHIERPLYPDDVLNYLRTWSSVKNYRNAHDGSDPVELFRQDFYSAWGETGEPKTVTHPMLTRLFVVNRL